MQRRKRWPLARWPKKQAFIEKMNSHRQKLRQAMLKEDPSLEPIFAEIDKHEAEMQAKQLGFRLRVKFIQVQAMRP